jgi:tetratricopeptide (TPR) repeat protein
MPQLVLPHRISFTASSHRLLAAILFLPMAAHGADSRLANCEAVWKQLFADSVAGGRTQDNLALFTSWKGHEATCKGTGVYEFRLAAIQVALGDSKAAQELMRGASAWPSPYAQNASLLGLRLQLTEYGKQEPPPMDKIRELKPRYLAAVAALGDSPAATEQVANYLVIISDYLGAIKYAEQSLKLQSDQWDPNRSLAIAYSHTGNYAGAVFAGRRAQELRNSLIKDPEFMYAVTRGYAGVGNIKVAEMTLALLNQQVPSERGSRDWNGEIAFIRAQIAAGNQKN